MRHCDLCIIGSGPGGQKAALQAAKLGKSVCIVERMEFVGGVAIHTGTIPSKALREAVMAVTGAYNLVRSSDVFTGRPDEVRRLVDACARVVSTEADLVRKQLLAAGVEILLGHGSFVDPHMVQVDGPRGVDRVSADHVVIAVGTTPSRPPSIRFDGEVLITSDDIVRRERLPKTMIVVGGGVIGTEYASMLAALGVKVTIIEGRPRLLDFIDQEVCEALQYHLRQMGCTLRLGEKVAAIRAVPASENGRGQGAGLVAEAVLESGKTLVAECLMYSIGRQGATGALNLAAAGLEADSRGRIKVDAHHRTAVPHIYAVGDVIGFPALASTSMEQGRVAASHMFGHPTQTIPELIPYGIYSIPEISMVGWTEERLTAEAIPYEVGVAQYREIARGQLLHDEIGMLKLLIHQESRALLGVHAIGTNATELIHIGQAVMAFKGTADYLVNTVFNYPTLAECYKVAAINALNQLGHV